METLGLPGFVDNRGRNAITKTPAHQHTLQVSTSHPPLSYTPLPLSYAGVDLILDRDGYWRVIEVNDHPVALAQSLELYSAGCNIPEIFQPDPFAYLAAILAQSANNSPIVLLLPESFELERNDSPVPTDIVLSEALQYDDPRVDLTISDFNHLSFALQSLGCQPAISDIAHLFTFDGNLYLDGGQRVHALFRRHSRFPTHPLNCLSVNDIRQRLVCGDKAMTYEASLGILKLANTIPTYPFSALEDTLSFLNECAIHDIPVITKPRWGSASVGVNRLSATDALKRLEQGKNSEATFLCQPWIEPAVTVSRGKEYYYDLRVFVVAGNPTFGFARRAAAPSIGVASNSPLSWLTTTGPRLAICDGQSTSEADAPAIRLSNSKMEELTEVVSATIVALSGAGNNLDHAKAVSRIPAYHALADMEEDFEVLKVRQGVRHQRL
jgi:hypothetical protein